MTARRWTMLGALGMLLSAAPAAAASTMELRGTIDVPPFGPGGSLALPLPSGAAPVQILVLAGRPGGPGAGHDQLEHPGALG